jgi:hypothetical protein
MTLDRMRWPGGALCALALVLAAGEARAQRLLSFNVGGGHSAPRNGATATSTRRPLNAIAAAQLDVPLLPLAVRVDALLVGWSDDTGPLSLTGNLVLPLRLPVITPYVVAGYGHYGVGSERRREGWNAGAGVRLGVGRVGVFAEARRHQVFARDAFSFGLTF